MRAPNGDELLTSDHIDAKSDENKSFLGDREAYTIKDYYSGLLHCYPCKSKSSSEVYRCINHFCGSRKAKQMYSDRAGEIRACLS